MNTFAILAIATTLLPTEVVVPALPETTPIVWPELELSPYPAPSPPLACGIIAPETASPPPAIQASLVEARHFYINIESELGQFERKSFYRLSLPPAAPNMGLQRDAWTSELARLRQAISELKRP